MPVNRDPWGRGHPLPDKVEQDTIEKIRQMARRIRRGLINDRQNNKIRGQVGN